MHKQLPWLLAFSLLFFWPCESFCGEKNNYTYNYRQIGSGVTQVQNTLLSPLAFSGSGINIQTGNNKSWDEQLRTSNITINLNHFGHPNETSTLQGGDLSYCYLRYYKTKASLPGKTDFFIGGGYTGSLDILYNQANINNSIFYSFNTCLNIGFFLGKKWEDYFFSNEFSIPILGLYSSSEYASSLPYTFYEDDITFLSKADFGSLNLNSIFRNSFSFDVLAKTKHKAYTLRFNYTITYGRQNINNITYNKAYHQVGIGYLLNTKHHEY